MASEDLRVRDLIIVDDDAAICDVLSAVFTLTGYCVKVFTEAEPFLSAARLSAPAGVLLDLHLPDKSGLTVLKELNAKHYPAPIFIISGGRDIAYVVEAIKCGAFDYLLKPFNPRGIAAHVSKAIDSYAKRNDPVADANGIVHVFSDYDRLTPRECEVLEQIAAGATNKEAGRCLGISPRTIEMHRAHIMEKIGARNAADLMRIVFSSRNASAPPAPLAVC
jgi:FixJ family two-component response regulator